MENINEHEMTKRILDRIRNNNSQSTSLNEVRNPNIQNSDNKNSNNLISEHDITKNMLSRIRENDFQQQDNTGMETDTEQKTNDVVAVESDELSDEASKLRDMVGGVDLKLYEVYPKDNNVVMVGILDNGIEFKFSKKEGAPYVNMDNMRLDVETVEIIKKLQGYYVNWIQYWAEKISEYSHTV